MSKSVSSLLSIVPLIDSPDPNGPSMVEVTSATSPCASTATMSVVPATSLDGARARGGAPGGMPGATTAML